MFYEFHKKWLSVPGAYGAPPKAIAWLYEFGYSAGILFVLFVASELLRLPSILTGFFLSASLIALSITSLILGYINKKSSVIYFGSIGGVPHKKKDYKWVYYWFQFLSVTGAILLFLAAIYILKTITGL